MIIWDGKTMKKQKTIPPPTEHIKIIRAVTVSPDGMNVAIAGTAPDDNETENKNIRRVVVYGVAQGEVINVLEVKDVDSDISQVFYLSKRFDVKGYSATIGLLLKSGNCRFVNTETSHEVGKISEFHRIHFPSYNGSYLAAIRASDATLDIIKTAEALPKIQGLSAGPLVKSVTKLWKRKTTETKAAEDDGIDYNTTSIERSRTRNFSCPNIRIRQTAAQSSTGACINNIKGVNDVTRASLENDLLGDAKISRKKLGRILQGYNSYPERYRTFIWRTLLDLPGNEQAFTSLVARGIHPSWKNLENKFQIKSPRLIRILEKIISALAYWSEIFSELEYLPMLIFPFVKLFQNNHLVCFETCATFLKSFCLHWFEFFPNPPIGVLSLVENILADNDRVLYHHLVTHKITSQTYALPILKTGFSEVLTREAFLVFYFGFSIKISYFDTVFLVFC